jgi:hypothetical protein
VGYEHDTRRIIGAGLLAAAALGAEHVLLWHKSVRLTQEQGYIVGTATLGVAFASWAIPAGEYRALAAAATIATIGAVPVIGGYWFRRRMEAERRGGYQQGALIREAREDAAPRPGD